MIFRKLHGQKKTKTLFYCLILCQNNITANHLYHVCLSLCICLQAWCSVWFVWVIKSLRFSCRWWLRKWVEPLKDLSALKQMHYWSFVIDNGFASCSSPRLKSTRRSWSATLSSYWSTLTTPTRGSAGWQINTSQDSPKCTINSLTPYLDGILISITYDVTWTISPNICIFLVLLVLILCLLEYRVPHEVWRRL